MATFRDELIRAVFEARRDVRWWEKVEPQLRDRDLDPASITSYRQAWNEDMEKKDWVGWQKEAQRYSNAVLDDLRMDCIDRLDAIGMLQWVRDYKAAGERGKLRQILGGTPVRVEKPLERSRATGREM
jgi:hypothetical protein